VEDRLSAFIRTELERMLRDLQVDTLILTGFSTNACVGLTAIDAYECDFRVVLAAEAILGTNIVQGNLMLDYLRIRFGIVPTPIAEIMELVSSGAGTGA
jgi:isochorismate hydrolase